jgi:RNA polymerase sigma-70 factor (ECF subfamily)
VIESDYDLMRRVQRNDGDAFDSLFARYVERVRTRVRQMVQDPAVAEDTVQEVFYRVWEKSGSYTGAGPVGAWIYRIAYNQAVSAIRRRQRELPISATQADDEWEEAADSALQAIESSDPGPAAELERRQLQDVVRRLVSELPESKRDVIRLIHGQDLSVAQTASALGVSAGTVKSRLYYGRKLLERQLREYLEE